jgi:peptide/nickel transport system permease protein
MATDPFIADAPHAPTIAQRILALPNNVRDWLADRAHEGGRGTLIAITGWTLILPIVLTIGLFVLPLWLLHHRKPFGAFGALLLLITVIVAIFAPIIVGALPPEFPANKAEYVHSFLSDAQTAPNTTFFLGTDPNGRDLLTRIIFGAEITVLVGFGTVLVTAIVSVLIGVTSGYFGGKVDLVLQRLVDVWIAFPPLFLLITVVAVLDSAGTGFLGIGSGPNVGPQAAPGDRWIWEAFPRTTVIILSLSLIFAVGNARIIRGAVLSIKSEGYVEAARGLGGGNLRIMRVHILPNIMPIVIVLASINLGAAVLVEAIISFLGLGIPPPFPTWGQMLNGLARVIGPSNWWVVVFPGLAIFLAVYGFNMMGDALRDIFDPRLRGSR